MINTKRAILVSASIITLCMCIVVGATYALFTDSATIKNHLKAGKLEIELWRNSLTYSVLDDEGYLVDKTDGAINFTDSTDKNIFGVSNGDATLLIPTGFLEAEMEVKNNGNVAFTYGMQIVYSEALDAIADQVELVITPANGTAITKRFSEIKNGDFFELGEIAGTAGTSQKFTVKITFLDDVPFNTDDDTTNDFSNNAVMEDEIMFDMIVSAVQVTN